MFRKTLALASLSLLGLTACQHTSVGTPSYTDTVTRNTVQMVRLSHEIKAEEDSTDTPSSGTYRAIDAFLMGIDAGYGDVMILDTNEVSLVRLRAIEDHIRQRGFVYGGIQSLGETPKDGAIILYVERHVAQTPVCGNWPAEVSNNQRNNTSPYLGCSNTANLGLMIANPRDLVAGQFEGNSTGAAVGAIYSPAPANSGPSITMSFDGMPGMDGATPVRGASK